MKLQTCLLTYFIRDNDIVSSCDFKPLHINNGVVIYEVIRVISGVPLFYNDHVTRFLNSIKNAGYNTHLTKRQLSLRIKALIDINILSEGNIKFQLCFNSTKPEIFTAWICPFLYPDKQLYLEGVSMTKLFAERINPNIKVFNKDLSLKAASIISNTDAYEILLVDKSGYVTEGSRSNIFFIKDDEIFTPKVSSVLPGITRLKVIKASNNANIICNEVKIKAISISEYQGAFITGTSLKVLPVKNIDNTYFSPGTSTIKLIMTEFENICNKDIASFKDITPPSNQIS